MCSAMVLPLKLLVAAAGDGSRKICCAIVVCYVTVLLPLCVLSLLQLRPGDTWALNAAQQ